jgi:DNA-binding protein
MAIQKFVFNQINNFQQTMDQRIQLRHPANKKAVSMAKDKYDVLKNALLDYLKIKGESIHSEIFHAITQDFKNNQTNFEGSVPWHLEWVLLDMEAKKEIKRIEDKSPVKFSLPS